MSASTHEQDNSSTSATAHDEDQEAALADVLGRISTQLSEIKQYLARVQDVATPHAKIALAQEKLREVYAKMYELNRDCIQQAAPGRILAQAALLEGVKVLAALLEDLNGDVAGWVEAVLGGGDDAVKDLDLLPADNHTATLKALFDKLAKAEEYTLEAPVGNVPVKLIPPCQAQHVGLKGARWISLPCLKPHDPCRGT